jgi:hypothetical protein
MFIEEIINKYSTGEKKIAAMKEIDSHRDMTYKQIVERGIELRMLTQVANVESFLMDQLALYSDNINDIPPEIVNKLKRYLDLFSEA